MQTQRTSLPHFQAAGEHTKSSGLFAQGCGHALLNAYGVVHKRSRRQPLVARIWVAVGLDGGVRKELGVGVQVLRKAAKRN